MAIAVDAVGTASGSSGSTLTWSHTVGAGVTNGLLMVAMEDSTTYGGPVRGVTYGGTALTQILDVTAAGPSASRDLSLWYLKGVSPGTASIVATMVNSGDSVVGASISFSGVNQTTPLGTAASGVTTSSGATSMSATTTGGASSDLVVAALGARTTTSPSASSPQTQQWSKFLTTNSYGVGGTQPGGTGSIVSTFTMSVTDAMAVIAVAIKAATTTVSGTGTGSFSFSGAATATSTLPATGAGSFGFTGAATGVATLPATGSGSFTFAGAAAGTPKITGTGSGSFGFTGSATGTASGTISGTGSGTFTFDGLAAGSSNSPTPYTPTVINTLELDAPQIGGKITIQRTSGTNLKSNGQLSVGTFGIDSNAQPYYDTTGPAPGEAAILGWDGSINSLFLDSRTAADPHLMLLAGVTPHLARVRARHRSAPRPEPAPVVMNDAPDMLHAMRTAARSRTPPTDDPQAARANARRR